MTGGAGFIGSHVADAYVAAGDEVWVLDNLSSGRRANVPHDAEFVELDIRDADVRNLFREVRFDLVNHHAAQIDVRASVSDPGKDASINLQGLLNLTEAAIEVGHPERFVFVSSGGVVYGEPEEIPTPEQRAQAPTVALRCHQAGRASSTSTTTAWCVASNTWLCGTRMSSGRARIRTVRPV